MNIIYICRKTYTIPFNHHLPTTIVSNVTYLLYFIYMSLYVLNIKLIQH